MRQESKDAVSQPVLLSFTVALRELVVRCNGQWWLALDFEILGETSRTGSRKPSEEKVESHESEGDK